ncbi:ribosome biogenesis GTPase Der [Pseudothermotoga thermarum]|nr:ribosome biogenesis GTPase Der [Pseudothermotoga thermarum]
MAVVVIAGRTNVGKSTLFNRLIGKRKAITEDAEGVTRDSLKGLVDYDGTVFELYDTCGVFSDAEDEMLSSMRNRAFKTYEKADLILFVVDGRAGITAEDEYVAEKLRKLGKKVILVINKSENPKVVEANLGEFLKLGFTDYVIISAQHGINVDVLLDKIVQYIGKQPFEEKIQQNLECPKIAIVGKPNVGKSSLFNAILKDDRATVTSIPGTTRDPVDELVNFEGKSYVFIDTAGLRRKSRIEYKSLEHYSVARTIDVIEGADVVLLVIDATEGVTRQDKRIAGLAIRRGKALVIVINKCDLVKVSQEEYRNWVYAEAPFLDSYDVVFTSAVKYYGIKELFKAIDEAYSSYCRTVSKAALNKLVSQLPILSPNLVFGELKIFSIEQVGTKPPKFTVVVNKKEHVNQQVSKTIENLIRDRVDEFRGSPLILTFKERR